MLEKERARLAEIKRTGSLTKEVCQAIFPAAQPLRDARSSGAQAFSSPGSRIPAFAGQTTSGKGSATNQAPAFSFGSSSSAAPSFNFGATTATSSSSSSSSSTSSWRFGASGAQGGGANQLPKPPPPASAASSGAGASGGLSFSFAPGGISSSGGTAAVSGAVAGGAFKFSSPQGGSLRVGLGGGLGGNGGGSGGGGGGSRVAKAGFAGGKLQRSPSFLDSLSDQFGADETHGRQNNGGGGGGGEASSAVSPPAYQVFKKRSRG